MAVKGEDEILAVLATMAPLSFIQSTFNPEDAEQLICGHAFVDLNFLRKHTIYQVGILEDDPHVVNFWAALDSFSQEWASSLSGRPISHVDSQHCVWAANIVQCWSE